MAWRYLYSRLSNLKWLSYLARHFPLLIVVLLKAPLEINHDPLAKGHMVKWPSVGEHPIYVDWANDGKRVAPY